ncbi:creatininase family protein [Kushneria phosphatilytica]|uniref:Creatininase family protein n=1 Tax=Kushneria phosphatilytica TaxID=657387 RepID=A0A1S1NSC5_9GAMM|nr:creatininase family protein [Kushneria phosphatilytica]OHV12164.1 creatininase [Kushneria phosphatilytica]QEL11356.1 creatininase family protein [Kushneria phosphatilytica]
MIERWKSWSSLTSIELGQLVNDDSVAVLPMAAIEQHGAHLPLSTDVDITEGILHAALEKLSPGSGPVLQLPTMTVALSPEHNRFPGTLSLTPEVAMSWIESLGESVARTGIRRLVMFNGHGGNRALMDMAALRLRELHELLVVKVTYPRFTPPTGWLPEEELRFGLHGGAVETAMMLHLHPEQVRVEAMSNAPSLGLRRHQAGQSLGPEGPAGFAWMAEDLNSEGVTGDATLANAALGERLVRHFAERTVEVLQQTREFDLASLALHRKG